MAVATIFETSRQRYLALFEKMQVLLNEAFDAGKDSDPHYCIALMSRLGKLLMGGLDRNVEIADDDPDAWELTFIMQLEPLYLKLEFADLLPHPLAHVIFDDVRVAVNDWVKTLRVAVKHEGADSALCHYHSEVAMQASATQEYKSIPLCDACYRAVTTPDMPDDGCDICGDSFVEGTPHPCLFAGNPAV